MIRLIFAGAVLLIVCAPANAQDLDKTKAAIDAGLKTKTEDCNKYVQAVANQLGLKAFDGKTADEIDAILASAKKTGKLDRWAVAGGNYTVENAFDRAQLGDLVIGVIDSKTRNSTKPKEDKTNYTHGHVFIVVGVKKGKIKEWRDLDIANAGIGGTPQEREPRIMKANQALRKWEEPHVKLYNLVP